MELKKLIEHASSIIFKNEGNYSSVNKNDNGAMSIGKLQWHGSRALNLLRRILGADPNSFKRISLELFNEVLTTTDLNVWSKRIASPNEAIVLAALLALPKSKDIQDIQANEDVLTYLEKGAAYGLIDPGCLIYFADGINQYGNNSSLWRDAAKSAVDGLQHVNTMHKFIIITTSQYHTRRINTYNAVLKILPTLLAIFTETNDTKQIQCPICNNIFVLL